MEHALRGAEPEGAAEVLVKGLDLPTRTAKVSRLLSGFPEYIETDYDRFDRSISLPYLFVQDAILLSCIPDPSPLFLAALEAAHETTGVSDYGAVYRIIGTRCSGDAHTSIGNGLINAFNFWLCCPSSRFLCEGDDGLIGTHNAQRDLTELGMLSCLGFSAKIALFNQIDDTSFCGRHFYRQGGSVLDHADVYRSLDKFHTTVSNMRAKSLIYAKARSYYHTDANTPLIGPLCYALITALHDQLSFSQRKRALTTASKERWLTFDDRLQADLAPVDRPIITAEARVSVCRRTNIPPDVQIAYEKCYMQAAERKAILHWPKILRDWNIRPDGFIYGDPGKWVI